MPDFGPWFPDQPEFNNPGVIEATNVVRERIGYSPFPSIQAVHNALDNPARGAFSFIDQTGGTQAFAGDSLKLYRRTGAGYADVSKVGGYVVPSEGLWDFNRFGRFIIAANGSDTPQVFDLSSSSVFADLANAPTFTYGAVIKNFLFGAQVSGDLDFPLHWSGQNDITEWTPGNKSSGRQAFPTGGQLLGITGGDFGLVLQQSALTRVSFIGGTDVFQFDTVAGEDGTIAAGSIVRIERFTYFLSNSGFKVFDGSRVLPIGRGKIDETILARLDRTNLHRMSVAFDLSRAIILWTYVSKTSPDGEPDRGVIYKLTQDQWTETDDLGVQIVFSDRSDDQAVDGLDVVLETLDIPVDSSFFDGGAPQLAGFNDSNTGVNFTGPNLAATIETPEFQAIPGQKTRLRGVRMIVDGDYTVTVRQRDIQTDALTDKMAASPRPSGRTPLRAHGRYQRLRLDIPAATPWTSARGWEDLEATAGGRR